MFDSQKGQGFSVVKGFDVAVLQLDNVVSGLQESVVDRTQCFMPAYFT
jgi:hypothetical protein